MTVQNQATLKGYFDAGDRPTEANFDDLIESVKRPFVTQVASTPYSVDATDDQCILVDASGGVRAINLPAGANNQRVLVKDNGSAGTNTVTITPNGVETIEGAANITLTTNYQWSELLWDNTAGEWVIINEGS